MTCGTTDSFTVSDKMMTHGKWNQPSYIYKLFCCYSYEIQTTDVGQAKSDFTHAAAAAAAASLSSMSSITFSAFA